MLTKRLAESKLSLMGIWRNEDLDMDDLPTITLKTDIAQLEYLIEQLKEFKKK